MSIFEIAVSLVAFVALGFGYVVALSDADMKKYRRNTNEDRRSSARFSQGGHLWKAGR